MKVPLVPISVTIITVGGGKKKINQRPRRLQQTYTENCNSFEILVVLERVRKNVCVTIDGKKRAWIKSPAGRDAIVPSIQIYIGYAVLHYIIIRSTL